jgi:NADH-quinone oxidoreductase subunit N
MMIMLAIGSMVLGNIVAIAQTNIKRMFAYSTIFHVGFMLLGIMAGGKDGYSASLFYILIYTLMSLGGFGLIILLSRQGFEAENIADFKGLSQRSPWFALMSLILLFSMAGIPPLAGFYAKLTVINAVIENAQLYVAVIAVLMSVIGAFYYLRVVKVMYFDKPDVYTPIVASRDMRWTLSLNALAVLIIGIFPGSLMAVCAQVFL